MDAKTDLGALQNLVEPSLIRGGPFYRGQRAIRLIHPEKWNMIRRATIAVVVGWPPLVVLPAVLNTSGLVSLLRDYRVYSRMLIAVPILLLGQAVMETRFRMLVGHFLDAGLVSGSEIQRMQAAIKTVLRLRDSALPELAIFLLVMIHTATSERTNAVVVSATIFQFLLGLGLWKWLLWAIFAFKLSRLKLNLVPTHPDEHGGLGFLSLTPIAFAPIVFAATAVIGSTWRHVSLWGEPI